MQLIVTVADDEDVEAMAHHWAALDGDRLTAQGVIITATDDMAVQVLNVEVVVTHAA